MASLLRRVSGLLCPLLGAVRRRRRGPVLLCVRRATERVRAPEPPLHLTPLDKADALMLRKSHETGFLSWFRNGLLATGIGVISSVQSDVGREAGYALFVLGGVCVWFGGVTYVFSLFALRRMMMLSLPALLLHSGVASSALLLWLCAVSLYIGRLEVEIIREEEEEDEGDECQDCRRHRRRLQEKEPDDPKAEK